MEGFGNSFLGFIIAIAICGVLFNGDPDISDSLRVIAEKWAASYGK